MIISVIGTQCIGKSTLIKDFLQANPKFILPDIDYRKIIEKNKLQLNREGNYRSQRCLFDFMKDQVFELAKNKDKYYILDRSLVDVLAYSYWLYDNKPEIFSKEQIIVMIEDLFKYIHVYNYLIYIPLAACKDVKIVNDNFRDTNEIYRASVDSNFGYLLNKYSKKIPPVISIFGNRTERIDMIKKNLPQIFN
jgi:uridine kinase